jgi:hypothetical protein
MPYFGKGKYQGSDANDFVDGAVKVRHLSNNLTPRLNPDPTTGVPGDIVAINQAGDGFGIIPPIDATPVPFAFTTANNVSPGTTSTSNSVTITGIDSNIPISIIGGEWELNNSGTWSTSDGVINANDTVRVRRNAGLNYNETRTVDLTVGNITETYTIINQTAVAPSNLVFSLPTNIAIGVATSLTVNVDNGGDPGLSYNWEVSIDDGATWGTTELDDPTAEHPNMTVTTLDLLCKVRVIVSNDGGSSPQVTSSGNFISIPDITPDTDSQFIDTASHILKKSCYGSRAISGSMFSVTNENAFMTGDIAKVGAIIDTVALAEPSFDISAFNATEVTSNSTTIDFGVSDETSTLSNGDEIILSGDTDVRTTISGTPVNSSFPGTNQMVYGDIQTGPTSESLTYSTVGKVSDNKIIVGWTASSNSTTNPLSCVIGTIIQDTIQWSSQIDILEGEVEPWSTYFRFENIGDNKVLVAYDKRAVTEAHACVLTINGNNIEVGQPVLIPALTSMSPTGRNTLLYINNNAVIFAGTVSSAFHSIVGEISGNVISFPNAADNTGFAYIGYMTSVNLHRITDTKVLMMASGYQLASGHYQIGNISNGSIIWETYQDIGNTHAGSNVGISNFAVNGNTVVFVWNDTPSGAQGYYYSIGTINPNDDTITWSNPGTHIVKLGTGTTPNITVNFNTPTEVLVVFAGSTNPGITTSIGTISGTSISWVDGENKTPAAGQNYVQLTTNRGLFVRTGSSSHIFTYDGTHYTSTITTADPLPANMTQVKRIGANTGSGQYVTLTNSLAIDGTVCNMSSYYDVPQMSQQGLDTYNLIPFNASEASSNSVFIDHGANNIQPFVDGDIVDIRGGGFTSGTDQITTNDMQAIPIPNELTFSDMHQLSSTKFVFIYGNINGAYSVIGTISGIDITWDTPIQFNTNSSDFGSTQRIGNDIIVIYRHLIGSGSGSEIVISIGAISNNTVTWASPSLIAGSTNNYASTPCFCSIGNDKIIVFISTSYSSIIYYTITITNSQTAGTSSQLTLPVSGGASISAYDSKVLKIADNKVLFVFSNNEDRQYGYSATLTISNDIIDSFTPSLFNDALSLSINIINIGNNNVILSFRNYGGSSAGLGYNGTSIIGTVGDTDVIWQPEVPFHIGDVPELKMVKIDNSKIAIIYHAADNHRLELVIGNISGTTLTFGTPVLYDHAIIGSGLPEGPRKLSLLFTSNEFIFSFNKNAALEPNSVVAPHDISYILPTTELRSSVVGVPVRGQVTGTNQITMNEPEARPGGNPSFTHLHQISDTKLVFIYGEADGTYSTVGTINNSNIIWDTPIQIIDTNSDYGAVIKIENNIVITCRVAAISKSTIIIGTIANNNITWAPRTDFYTSAISAPISCCDIGNDRIIIFLDPSTSGLHYCIADISNVQLITFSGVIQINPIMHNSGAAATPLKIADNKILVIFSNQNDDYSGYYAIGDIVGNTATFETPLQFSSGNTTYMKLLDISNDNIIVIYRHYAALEGKGRLGTISGNTINWQPEVSFNSGDIYNFDTTKISNTRIAVSYHLASDHTLAMAIGNISGTTLTFESPLLVDPDTGNGSGPQSISLLYMNSLFVFSYGLSGLYYPWVTTADYDLTTYNSTITIADTLPDNTNAVSLIPPISEVPPFKKLDLEVQYTRNKFPVSASTANSVTLSHGYIDKKPFIDGDAITISGDTDTVNYVSGDPIHTETAGTGSVTPGAVSARQSPYDTTDTVNILCKLTNTKILNINRIGTTHLLLTVGTIANNNITWATGIEAFNGEVSTATDLTIHAEYLSDNKAIIGFINSTVFKIAIITLNNETLTINPFIQTTTPSQAGNGIKIANIGFDKVFVWLVGSSSSPCFIISVDGITATASDESLINIAPSGGSLAAFNIYYKGNGKIVLGLLSNGTFRAATAVCDISPNNTIVRVAYSSKNHDSSFVYHNDSNISIYGNKIIFSFLSLNGTFTPTGPTGWIMAYIVADIDYDNNIITFPTDWRSHGYPGQGVVLKYEWVGDVDLLFYRVGQDGVDSLYHGILTGDEVALQQITNPFDTINPQIYIGYEERMASLRMGSMTIWNQVGYGFVVAYDGTQYSTTLNTIGNIPNNPTTVDLIPLQLEADLHDSHPTLQPLLETTTTANTTTGITSATLEGDAGIISDIRIKSNNSDDNSVTVTRIQADFGI